MPTYRPGYLDISTPDRMYGVAKTQGSQTKSEEIFRIQHR